MWCKKKLKKKLKQFCFLSFKMKFLLLKLTFCPSNKEKPSRTCCTQIWKTQYIRNKLIPFFGEYRNVFVNVFVFKTTDVPFWITRNNWHTQTIDKWVQILILLSISIINISLLWLLNVSTYILTFSIIILKICNL